MPAVELASLTRKFERRTAVDSLDLVVQAGEFFAFLGPNGAGKSTTIKLMAGMLLPTSGSARILGYDVVREPLEVKRRIGVLPEEIQLYERLTPLETVYLMGSLYGLAHAEIGHRSEELFDLLELSMQERGRMIIDFSMGMRKKVALACALLHGPKLLFLDEPFNGIDAVTTRAIKQALLEATGRGVTVFFSSHILEQVERLCTRIGIIQEGKLRALGTLAEIRSSIGADPAATLEDVFVRIVGGDRVPKGRLEFLG